MTEPDRPSQDTNLTKAPAAIPKTDKIVKDNKGVQLRSWYLTNPSWPGSNLTFTGGSDSAGNVHSCYHSNRQNSVKKKIEEGGKERLI